MNSDEILDLLDKIAATPGKNDKQKLVSAGVQFPSFQKALEYAYNPFKTYGLRKRPEVGYHGGKEFAVVTWELLDDLISRKLSGNAAIDAVRIEMTALSEKSAELLWRIIAKDMRAGFSESTINKAVKGLIPEFPYMRCSLPKDVPHIKEWPLYISQMKADGMFANCDHEEGGAVSLRSRQGSEFPMDKFPGIVDEILRRTSPGYQNHGEIVVKRGDEILPRQIGNGMLNSVLNGGDFEEGCRPVYLIWDQVPLSAVTAKGKHNVAYVDRLRSVIAKLKETAGDSVALIETRVLKTLPEAYAHAVELMKEGKEGTVVKHPAMHWKDGTSKEQVKLKLEFVVDLEIEGIVEGRAGTKNEGRPGSLACRTCDGLLKVDVTVKNEALRDRIEANPDEFIGKIIAVTANDIMTPSESNPLHSLFLPRMVEADYRKDKSVADSLAQVFAQKEAAIFGESLVEKAA